MRDFKGMKRQRGRNRGGNAGGGGGKPQHNANRAFDSNGPDGVKIRGNAQHVFEKYQQLARDAAGAGDRVLAENYLQHAEHYFRVLRAVQPQRPASDFLGRETFASGFDIDFEDEGQNTFAEGETAQEGEGEAAAEGEATRFESRGEQPYRDPRQNDRPREEWQNRDRQDRDRDRNYGRDQRQGDRPREDRYRDDRPRDERPRDERPREDRPRDERPRDDRPRDDRSRDDRSRDDRSRDERPREDRRERFQREGRFNDRPPREERDPLAVVEPETTPLPAAEPQLRSQDGSLSPAPAFLQPRAERAETAGEEEAKPARGPRRRRSPRTPEGEAAPETEEA